MTISISKSMSWLILSTSSTRLSLYFYNNAFKIFQYNEVNTTTLHSSPARRQITFHCEQDSHTITVPEGFEVEKANIVSDEFESGKVSVAVPMTQRSVFG